MSAAGKPNAGTRDNRDPRDSRDRAAPVVAEVPVVSAVSSTAVPRLRFKGFEGAWKKARLSQFLSVNDERNVAGKFGVTDVFSVSREFGVINQIEYQGRSFAGASLANYRVIHKGQITYTKSPLKAQPFGIIKANKAQSGILSALYGVYDCLERSSPEFIQTYFEKDDRLNSYLRPLINKGAKNTILVGDEEAIGGDVTFPTPSEQSRIADFFTNLDAAIAAAKARVGKLRRVKKAMLVKMFPREGATVPEIRFKGFAGAWEKKALADVFDERVERSADYELLSVTIGRGVVKASDNGKLDNSSEDKSNYKVVKPFDFAYNSMRMWQGACGCSSYAGIVSPAYTVLIPRATVDSVFFEYYCRLPTVLNVFQRMSQGMTSDTWNLKFPILGTIKMCFPSVAEQRKIGAFFNNLDRLIAAAEKRVAKLREVKAALLEGMFA